MRILPTSLIRQALKFTATHNHRGSGFLMPWKTHGADLRKAGHRFSHCFSSTARLRGATSGVLRLGEGGGEDERWRHRLSSPICARCGVRVRSPEAL